MAADNKKRRPRTRGAAATALATDKRKWFSGVGQQTNDAVMAAADKRRWQTRAEARTTAADQRGSNRG
jgi:hypothetical protein